ncbi:MAG: FGGY family carbohydrate kinase [Candidatus Omnitrophica bacterium]|nr:FGGY family carbohydrate kinase [Candidatus Omnitrophota bacterium]
MKKSILGIDIGTTKVKFGIIKDGDILLERFFILPIIEKKEVEQDILWKKIIYLLDEIFYFSKKKNIEIEKIGITSQAQTFITIDKNYNFLTNFILWNDIRAKKEGDILNKEFPNFYKFSGLHKFIPELMVCKVLYLKRNFPKIYKSIYKFLLLNEWLIFKLTGKFFGDDINFGMSGFYNIREKRFNKEILEFLSIEKDSFSEIYPCGKHFSFLKEDFIKKFNLKNKVKVYSCGNDQTVCAIGSGIDKNSCVINLGTAFVFYILIDEFPEKIEKNQICGIFPFGNYFLLKVNGDFGNYVKKGICKQEILKYFKKNFKIIEKIKKIENFYISGGYGKRFLKFIEENFKKNIFYIGANTSFKGIEKIIGEENEILG